MPLLQEGGKPIHIQEESADIARECRARKSAAQARGSLEDLATSVLRIARVRAADFGAYRASEVLSSPALARLSGLDPIAQGILEIDTVGVGKPLSAVTEMRESRTKK